MATQKSQRLDRDDNPGGSGLDARALCSLLETSQTHRMEALAPLADDLTWCVEMLRDPVVAVHLPWLASS